MDAFQKCAVVTAATIKATSRLGKLEKSEILEVPNPVKKVENLGLNLAQAKRNEREGLDGLVPFNPLSSIVGSAQFAVSVQLRVNM